MKIKISKIKPDATNQRSTGKDISELAMSIQQFGLLQPIGVTEIDENKMHTIIFGHRRFEAVQSLGWDLIEAEVISESESVTKMIQLTENIHRADVHPMDEARTIADLLKRGETQSFVSQTLGKSIPYVRKRMALNDLTEPIQEAFIRGNINITMAHKLAGLHTSVQDEIYQDNIDDFTEEGNTFESEWAVEREMSRLSIYKFDKTECETCPFNSAVNELFPGEESAQCGNPVCLSNKKLEYNVSLLEEAKTKVAYFIYDGYGTPGTEKQAIGDKLTEEGYTVLWKQSQFDTVDEPDADDYTEGETDADYLKEVAEFKNTFKAFDFNGNVCCNIVLSDETELSTTPSNVNGREITPEEQQEKIQRLIEIANTTHERDLAQANRFYMGEVLEAIEELEDAKKLELLKKANQKAFADLQVEYLNRLAKLKASHEIKLAELKSKL